MNLQELRSKVEHAPKGKRSATIHGLFALHALEFEQMTPTERNRAAEYITGNRNYATELAKMIGVRQALWEWGYSIEKTRWCNDK